METNCPNCGAPLTHLTSGDICEYCGTSFSFSRCQYIDPNFCMCVPSTYKQIQSLSSKPYLNIYADGELVDRRYVDPFENAISMMEDYDVYGRRR